MTDLEMAAKFREAAAGVRRGWNQYRSEGSHLEPDGHCALGWLTAVAGHMGGWELSTVAEENLGQGWLPNWNDAPERTREDVVALFESTAHGLELRHQIRTPAASSHEAILPTLKEAVLSNA